MLPRRATLFMPFHRLCDPAKGYQFRAVIVRDVALNSFAGEAAHTVIVLHKNFDPVIRLVALQQPNFRFSRNYCIFLFDNREDSGRIR